MEKGLGFLTLATESMKFPCWTFEKALRESQDLRKSFSCRLIILMIVDQSTVGQFWGADNFFSTGFHFLSLLDWYSCSYRLIKSGLNSKRYPKRRCSQSQSSPSIHWKSISSMAAYPCFLVAVSIPGRCILKLESRCHRFSPNACAVVFLISLKNLKVICCKLMKTSLVCNRFLYLFM